MPKTLTITDDKVKEAAAKCGDAAKVLKTLFPEVFNKPILLSHGMKFHEPSYGFSLRTPDGLFLMETNVNGPNKNESILLARDGITWRIEDQKIDSISSVWHSSVWQVLIPTRK